jgi:hypothetical protein
LLAELADGLGLTAGLSAAMAPTMQRHRGHDRGRVLTDLAVAIADGASAITDLRVLSDQPGLFGEVASAPTAWRSLAAVDKATQARIATARAAARAAAWAAGADPGFMSSISTGCLSMLTPISRARRRPASTGSGSIR